MDRQVNTIDDIIAEEDLGAARVLLREAKYSHASFLAQQSGEKAWKSSFEA